MLYEVTLQNSNATVYSGSDLATAAHYAQRRGGGCHLWERQPEEHWTQRRPVDKLHTAHLRKVNQHLWNF